MAKKSLADIRALVAANNLMWLQTQLESETDEARFDVLGRLLAIELSRIAAEPASCDRHETAQD